MLALLLLISSSVSAKSFIAHDFQDNQTENLNKAAHSFHENMLQPQVVHVSITSEHSGKPVHTALNDLFYSESNHLVLQPLGQTNVVLQDANRCESVSKLLFPFHVFW